MKNNEETASGMHGRKKNGEMRRWEKRREISFSTNCPLEMMGESIYETHSEIINTFLPTNQNEWSDQPVHQLSGKWQHTVNFTVLANPVSTEILLLKKWI